jgi:hypothetical protein
MGRDFKFRILLKGVPVPASVEELKRSKACECWGILGCDEFDEVDKEYREYATSWENLYEISRHNDVLGYCYHVIFDISGLRKKIQEVSKEMNSKIENGDYDVKEHTEVLKAFDYILHHVMRNNPERLVEIRYD